MCLVGAIGQVASSATIPDCEDKVQTRLWAVPVGMYDTKAVKVPVGKSGPGMCCMS